MSEYIKNKVNQAQLLHEEARLKAESGDFAYKLAAQSLQSHIDELNQIQSASEISPYYEILDLQVKALKLNDGSAPLEFVSKFSEELRKTLGYAALRLISGGISRKRIPKDLFSELDLRLSGLLQGSTRFVISAAANRDLLDDGLSKGAIERVFDVLSSLGKGESFLNAINTLGPSSAKSLRDFLNLIKSESAEINFTWNYSGEEVRSWNGTKEAVSSVAQALDLTEVVDQDKVLFHGKIELLSKRERIELRLVDDKLIKVLYPKVLLQRVSELHLEQEVTLYCQVTETHNPLTDESSIFYELLEIR